MQWGETRAYSTSFFWLADVCEADSGPYLYSIIV